eukprot:gene16563-18893_t
MKNRFESIDQVNNLREIQALRRLSPHEHIISLEEVLYDQPTGRLALVFELMDANLYELIRGRKHYLNTNLIKSYIWQLMKSLDHMHKKGIFHRDIKPENILIESSTDQGRGLKLADFGSCRGIYSKQPYTEYISTRWYRAPECLLTDGYYGPEMDLWGAGCVMFEITSLYPLFPGSNEVDQINRIHKVLGTPNAESLAKFKSKGASHISFDFPPQKGVGIPQLVPHASADSIDLMVKLLKYDASERITAREAMRHPYFKDVREAEAKLAAEAKTTSSSTITGAPSGEAKGASNAASDGSSLVGKNLPSITGTGAHQNQQADAQQKTKQLLQQQAQQQAAYQQQQQQQNYASMKPSGNTYSASIPTTTTISSLPPISSMGAGGTQFSKFAVNSGTSGQKSGDTPNNMMPNNNNNSQKRRKKYKTNYVQPSQQQKQRAAQSTEGVLKAYGVPKSSLSGAGGGYNNGMLDGGGGSKILDGGGSKYSIGAGAGTGAGAGAYGSYPNRHYVKKN